jgi:hypothetical protein
MEAEKGVSMGLKIEATITCDACKKEIKTPVVKRLGRHSDTLVFPKLYDVTVDYDDTITVKIGPDEYDVECGATACSMECAISLVRRELPKLKFKKE